MSSGYTAQLAEWISGLEYGRIPAEVVERMKWLTLDSIGCGLFGSTRPWCKMAAEAICAMDTNPGATVWGSSRTCSSPHAALVNGTYVQGYELDDAGMQTHAGASNVTSAFAVCEERGGVSGKRLLAALVGSYELLFRIGMCFTARGFLYQDLGWHQAGLLSPFGAAAAAGSLLRLSSDKLFHAFGLAGNRGIAMEITRISAMDKRMMQARGALNGIHSALLAERGFTGIENVLEADGGFCQCFTQSKDRYSLDELTRELGQKWYSPSTELKRYCGMLFQHGYYHTAKYIRDKYHPDPAQIQRIIIPVSKLLDEHTNHSYDRQDSETFAQFCIPFGVAAMLVDGDVFVGQYTPEKLKDPVITALAKKVEQRYDPSLENNFSPSPRPCPIIIEMLDGGKIEETRIYGGKASAMSQEEIVSKFHKLASVVASDARIERIVQMAGELEKLEDAAVLARELGF